MTGRIFRPRQRDDLTIVELDGEAVVFDEASRELHHLNPSATIVLSMCDGTLTAEEIAAAVSEAFDIPGDEVRPQVGAVLKTFADAGLLEEPGAA